MRFRPLSATVLLLLLVSRGLTAQGLRTAPPEQLGLAPDRLERIVTLVQDAVDRNEVAGAVTLVARSRACWPPGSGRVAGHRS